MTEARELLQHINPSALNYNEWLAVGMALKDSGATASEWEAWSRGDADRYKAGECFRKWEGFHGSPTPITAGTLVALARQQGWTPPADEGRAYEWDEPAIQVRDELRVVDSNWLQVDELPEPTAWNPVHDLTTYLSALFQADEHVGYVTDAWEKDGKYLPKRGVWDRTAGQLIELLGRCNGDIGSVIGDIKPQIGAWIRFNPLDGKGVRDENVTAFRYALVESDDMPLDRQNALLRELELPVAALVSSGGKSVHAIVRVDADTMDQYRKRVDFLYEVCGRNGLKLDRQNRNPSRLSRMPGVLRNGRKQWLIATNIGKASWQEWEDWVIDLNDDLPAIEAIDVGQDEPILAPELISGILREGHKLLLSGSSKAGKSFALIQLAIAISSGDRWLGWPVGRGRVLYVNLELDAQSCRHRFWAIHKTLGVEPVEGMIDVWNLRGSAVSLDKLAPKLIRRALKKRYKAVIIDPIYKVLTGDENSAEEMARFCNEFDRICTQLGAATIYCHHHSKGAQGHKKSEDRASGSGVFARDPDAIVDLIELDIDADRRKAIVNRWECDAMAAALDRLTPEWRAMLGQDDTLASERLWKWAADTSHADAIRPIRAKARQEAEDATGWRVEATLREFRTPPAKAIWFRYPVHLVDTDGALADAKADGEEPPWMKNRMPPEEKKRRRNEAMNERKQERLDMIEAAVQSKFGEQVTTQDVADYCSIEERTARRWIEEHPNYEHKKGFVFAKPSPEAEK